MEKNQKIPMGFFRTTLQKNGQMDWGVFHGDFTSCVQQELLTAKGKPWNKRKPHKKYHKNLQKTAKQDTWKQTRKKACSSLTYKKVIPGRKNNIHYHKK